MKKWQKRIFVLIVAIIVLVIFLCLGILVQIRNITPFSSENYFAKLEDNSSIRTMEMNSKIKFPPSAHEIFLQTEGLNEVTTYTKFSMNAGEVSRFLESTLCEDELIDAIDKSSMQYSDTPEWWGPETAINLRECKGVGEFTYQWVFVDTTDSEKYIVYVLSKSRPSQDR